MCLIANQCRPVQKARVKPEYQSRRSCPAPSAGSTGRSTAHAAGGPRSVDERDRPGDGGAQLARCIVLPPLHRRLKREASREGELAFCTSVRYHK